MRLGQSIVRFKGEPHYVKSVDGSMICAMWDMIGGHGDIFVNANDDRIDVSSVPLFFINLSFGSGGFYIVRYPTRQQKQGMSFGLCSALSLGQGRYTGLSDATDSLLAYRKSYDNVFPDFNDAISHNLALSKTWGFRNLSDPAVKLVYNKLEPVAFYIPSENLFKFKKGSLSRFRQLSLNELLVKKGNPGVSYDFVELK